MRFSTLFALAFTLLASGALAQPRHGQGGGGLGGGGPNGGSGGGHGRGADHGQGQGHNQGQGQGQNQGQGQARGNQPSQIVDADRGLIQAYFGQQIAQGNCPPGLAKKNDGCQPPGQARKWALGQPLPAGLGYPLPPDLLGRLAPPAGYTYMRVGTDVLMIAAGTRMVVSGLADLLR